MKFPAVPTHELVDTINSQAEELGVEPLDLLGALGVVLGVTAIGEEKIAQQRVTTGQALAPSNKASEYTARVAHEEVRHNHARLEGAAQLERRQTNAFEGAKRLLEAQIQAAPELSLVEEQVA